MTDPMMPPQIPSDPRSAKQQARAERAYKKAQRNFFLRHKILSAVLAVILLAIVAGVAGSSGKDKGNAITGQKADIVAGPTDTAAATTAPAATKAATAPRQTAGVGDSLHVTGNEGLDATITLVGVEKSATAKTQYASAPKNGRFYALKILVNCAAGSYDYNPFYFKLQTEDGTDYGFSDGNALSAGFEPALHSGTLNAGQKTAGYVVFDLPASAGKPLVLTVTDQLFGNVGQWEFKG